MIFALVTACAREVRRLVRAGSDLARGDFRLERLRPPLRAVGARAPVFARLAGAVGRVVEAGGAETADRLLDLATLVRAVQATQAGPGVGAGEVRPLAATPVPGATVLGCRQLGPVLAALTATGPGRLEAVRHGWEQGCFRDPRLAAAAVRGLGDPREELATFLAETVLPGYGPAVVPLLRAGLDLRGGKAHARRLALIARFRGPAGNDLYRAAAEEGSPEVRAVAVSALRHDPGAAPRLRAWARQGTKEIRAAALEALGCLEPAASAPLLVEVLCAPGGAAVALPAARTNRSPALTAALVAAGRDCLRDLTNGEPAGSAESAAAALAAILAALGQRSDPGGATAFLGECLDGIGALCRQARAAGAPPRAALLPPVARALWADGTPRALGLLAGARGRFDEWLLGAAFRAAVVGQPPAEVFEAFAPCLDHREPDRRDAVLAQLRGLVRFRPACRLRTDVKLPHHGHGHEHAAGGAGDDFPLPGDGDQILWDPRWPARLRELDGWPPAAGAPADPGAPDLGLPELVAALVAPGDAASLRYLEARLDRGAGPARPGEASRAWYGDTLLLLGLVQGGHPRAAAWLFEAARRVSRKRHAGLESSLLSAVAQKLSPAESRAFLQRLPELPRGDTRARLWAALPAAFAAGFPDPGGG